MMSYLQRPMILLCGFIIISTSLFSVINKDPSVHSQKGLSEMSTSTKIEQGQLFTIEKSFDLSEEAYPALKIYLDTLLFSRPLPWPYRIDGFGLRPGRMVVRGQLIESGDYVIPLGVLWWKGMPYVLPSFSCTAVPISVPTMSFANLLLPFPDAALLPTDSNAHLASEMMALNQKKGIQDLYWRDLWRNCFAIVGLFVVCIPVAIQLWRWYVAQRSTLPVSVPVNPGLVFRKIQAVYSQGKKPWEEVLYTLNLIASYPAPTLTSYELTQYFTAHGEAKFAEAATLIEKYGYRPEKDQYFDQVLQVVEKGLSEKNFLK